MSKPIASLNFSHVGICVSDLERSLRFYCQGLGFELVESHTVGTEFGKLMEAAGNIVLQSRFVTRDGVRIELLRFDEPGYQGHAVRRPMNQLGPDPFVGAGAGRGRRSGGCPRTRRDGLRAHANQVFQPRRVQYGFRLLHRILTASGSSSCGCLDNDVARLRRPNLMRNVRLIFTASLMLTVAV